jgi:hypothetical protein
MDPDEFEHSARAESLLEASARKELSRGPSPAPRHPLGFGLNRGACRCIEVGHPSQRQFRKDAYDRWVRLSATADFLGRVPLLLAE